VIAIEDLRRAYNQRDDVAFERALLAIIPARVPGIMAQHCIVSDTCRTNRTDGGAFNEAMERLRQAYRDCCKGWPIGKEAKLHLVLTVERPELSPLPSNRESP